MIKSRLKLFLVSVFSFTVISSFAQPFRITLSLEKKTLKEFITQVESLADYSFMLGQSIDQQKLISVKAEDTPIEELLDQALAGTGIAYEIAGRQIVLTNIPQTGDVGQYIPVKGKVVDESGEPVVGANVMEKNTLNGSVTDVEGNFSLRVHPGSILVISYIGYVEQQIKVNNQTNFSIVMKEDFQLLDEVVVVGYGVVKKRDLTGSVSSISADKIAQIPVVNPAQAIQGRAAGVLVQVTDHSPSGGSLDVRIRGNRSFTTNTPLYVVDGMPITTGIEAINPADIEAIDILKDASATAIYGSRGANGVIIVTTKKGKAGKVQVDYDGYVGIQTIARKLDLMDGAEWTEALREAYRSTGLYTSLTPSAEQDAQMPRLAANPYSLQSVLMAYDENGNYDPSRVRSFDWIGATMHEALTHSHNLNVRGGSDKTQYSVSASYSYKDGILRGRDYEKYTARVNLDQEISKVFKVGLQTQYTHSHENLSNGAYGGSIENYPVSSPYDEEGNLILNPGGDAMLYNSLMNLENVVHFQKLDRYLGTFYAEASIIDGLKLRTNVGTDSRNLQKMEFYGSMTTNNKGGQSTAGNSGEKTYLFTLDNMLIYNKRINGIHDLNITGLQSIQRFVQDKYGINVKDLPYEYQLGYNVGSASSITGVSSDYLKWTMASFMGRINYTLLDRYLLTVSARYDGSSRLAKGHKWVLFPSAALAWRIMDEPFMPAWDFLSNLKIRIGWGRTGSSAVDPYKTMGGLSLQKYNYGDTQVIGYYPSVMPNPNLSWETTEQTNLGIDFGFLNGRINAVLDLYLQRTSDLLMSRQLPVVSGYGSITANIGKTQNKGIEFTLNTINLESRKGLTWTSDLILYSNKEEIVELYNGKKDDVGNKWFIGQPLSVIYDYKFDRIWQNTPEDLAEMEEWNKNGSNFKPGTIKLVDQDGDKKITAEDRVIIGNPRPKLVASLGNNFFYRGFDLSVFLNAEFGNKYEYSAAYNLNGRENYIRLNYWTETNPSNEAPQPNANQAPQYVSTIKYYNGSYVRVRDITLGYTLPDHLIRKATLSRLRFYASVQNAFLFTSFPGIDPEGARGNSFPTARTFLFGVNASF